MTYHRTALKRLLSLALAAASLTVCTPPLPPPATCAEAVERASNDPRMRIQGGTAESINERENARVRLYLAATAASAGNEAECRRQLGLVYLR